MGRIGTGWLAIAVLVFGSGCPEAVYTLGRLSTDDPTRDASTSDAAVGGADASAGSSGIGGAAGTGGASGTGGTGGTTQCTPRYAPAERRGFNLYVMLDSSFGVALQPVWPQLTQALTAFFEDPANDGIGVGLRSFGVSCNPDTYAMPNVEIGLLPATASSLVAALPAPVFGLGAALGPAIEGGLRHASAVEMADPTRDTDLLLITDGFFDATCGVDLSSAVQATADAFAGPTSTETHVIAIDSTLFGVALGSDLDVLDAVAAAGGTVSAQRVTADLNSTAALRAALRNARVAGEPCELKVPAGFVAARTVVEWQVNGATLTWSRIASADACGTRSAIYPVADPNFIGMCPAACATLVNANGTVLMREDCP